MRWRVYRLPGSRGWWLVDSGVGTPVIHIQQIEFRGSHVETVNDGAAGVQPISWLQVEGELHYDEKQRKMIFTPGSAAA